MAVRTSIELHPDGCRLVEVQVSPRGRRAPAGDVRVTVFLTAIPGADDAAEFGASLGRLRQDRSLGREAWVTVWGLRTTQQLLRLPPAQPEALEALARREARKDLAPFESEPEGASVAVAAGGEVTVGSHRRREVSLIGASTAEIRRRIQPLVDAGFVVRGVSTPAMALASLSRSRKDAPAGIAAYVAVLGRAVCLAIVRDGLLLFAREMPWGHSEGAMSEGDGGTGVQTRLASELKRSILFFKQTFRAPVETIVLCGDMPNLRMLTGPIGDALALPVQTLDSLVGIDAAAVPEPADQFRASVASLRIAIAAGSEPNPSANLLPAAIRRVRESHLQAVRLALATAASVLLVGGWYYLSAQTASHQRVEIAAIERQLAMLEPDAVRVSQLHATYRLTMAQQAALTAFDSEGPRLARLLEALARSTPPEVVLTALEVQADGAYWQATVRGTAINEDAAVAQAAVNALLQALSDSPFVGPPVQPPARRVVSGRGGVSGSAAEPVPAGMSGVEFVADFRLGK